MAYELGYTSTGAMLSDVLRLVPGEAAARVRLAQHLGPRRTLTGEALEPAFPLLAAAVDDGQLSTRHAEVITRTITRIPDDILNSPVLAELVEQAEPVLVEHARTINPTQLARLAHRLQECLDPDGRAELEHAQERRRELVLTVLPDGSGRLYGYLTAAATALWATILSAVSTPAPADDGTPDHCTAAQRRHDGLVDVGHTVLRSGQLPGSGGAPVTVLVTMAVDQFEHRTGLVTTEHGGALSVPAALALAAGADLMPVILDHGGGVLAYGRAKRSATVAQRRSLAARDRGCSFPGCDQPPPWTQAHHVHAWADGGTTDLDNLTLLCGSPSLPRQTRLVLPHDQQGARLDSAPLDRRGSTTAPQHGQPPATRSGGTRRTVRDDRRLTDRRARSTASRWTAASSIDSSPQSTQRAVMRRI